VFLRDSYRRDLFASADAREVGAASAIRQSRRLACDHEIGEAFVIAAQRKKMLLRASGHRGKKLS